MDLGWIWGGYAVDMGWIWGGYGALKMAENSEKRRFTFFAFLPPYIGVSGSLAYAKGKIF